MDAALHHLADMIHIPEEMDLDTYVRDAEALVDTPADIKEYSTSYAFMVNMPGLKFPEIKVKVEDDKFLVISGERKLEAGNKGKCMRMERRMGKFMRNFSLPDDANMNEISAAYQKGVLTVKVEKLRPPEPEKNVNTIDFKVTCDDLTWYS